MLKKTAAVLLALAILPAGAFACTAVYVGSNLTADGSTIFARQEDYASDEGWPKLFEVIPEGAHKAGENYTSCYGFTWTFTHDSYGCTAFRDNNSQGVCPDGWRDSWYWVFSMLEHIARDDEDAAVYIREKMAALQDTIFTSGATGNPAAEICWHTALDLLSEFGR